MRYFYTLCLILSSFFTYKNLFANEQGIKYAFFIPENAFQQNVSFEEQDNYGRLRFQNNNYDQEDSENLYTGDIEPVDDFSDYYKTEEQEIKKETNKKITAKNIKKELPYVQHKISTDKIKPLPSVQQISETQTTSPKEKTKVSSDNELPQIKKPEIKKTLTLPIKKPEQKIAKNILDMSTLQILETLPNINPNKPNFKNIYAQYGTELKVLYKKGKLPPNFEQEEILKKATSSRRYHAN